MHTILANRRRHARGFSLVEILIVLLIIALLLAVAVPSLLNSRKAGGDRAAQLQLNTTATSARTSLVDTEDFSAADSVAEMVAAEPNIDFVYGTAAAKVSGVRQVSIYVSGDKETFWATSPGENDVCWVVRLQAAGADGYAKWENQTSGCSAQSASSAGLTYERKYPAS